MHGGNDSMKNDIILVTIMFIQSVVGLLACVATSRLVGFLYLIFPIFIVFSYFPIVMLMRFGMAKVINLTV